MNKLKKWFKENITTTDWIALFILLLAVVGIFYLPHWVTQKSWEYDLGETESNEIADTIGGILGPFISFISACLVYLALREQVKANRFLADEISRRDSEKYEFVIFNRVKKEFNTSITNIKQYYPLKSNHGQINEKERENSILFNHEYAIEYMDNVNYSKLISEIILNKVTDISNYEIQYMPLINEVTNLNRHLRTIHKEIKNQKYLKKEIEFLFLDVFKYFDFKSIKLFDIKKVKSSQDILQIIHLEQLIKFCKLFEELKKDFDEELNKDFDKIIFSKYNFNADLESAIVEQRKNLKNS